VASSFEIVRRGERGKEMMKKILRFFDEQEWLLT